MREVPPPVRDARTVLGLVARFEGPEIGRDGADARGLLEEVREEEFWGTALSLSKCGELTNRSSGTLAATPLRRISRQIIAVRLAEMEFRLRANDSASSRSLRYSAFSSRFVQPRHSPAAGVTLLPSDDADLSSE